MTASYIGNGGELDYGAPLVLNTTDDYILLYHHIGNYYPESNDPTEFFRIHGQLNGRKYPFWQRPFVGGDPLMWTAFRLLMILALFLLFCVICCICLKCCQCCCRCCKGQKKKAERGVAPVVDDSTEDKSVKGETDLRSSITSDIQQHLGK